MKPTIDLKWWINSPSHLLIFQNFELQFMYDYIILSQQCEENDVNSPYTCEHLLQSSITFSIQTKLNEGLNLFSCLKITLKVTICIIISILIILTKSVFCESINYSIIITTMHINFLAYLEMSFQKFTLFFHKWQLSTAWI